MGAPDRDGIFSGLQGSAVSRRAMLAASAGALAAAAIGPMGTAAATTAPSATPSGHIPTATRMSKSEATTLARLYREAKAEGGRLTVYAGGDTPTQQDSIKGAFLTEFPDIDLHLVVDLSKVHDARVDLQIGSGRVVADVVELQSLADFPRWKKEGSLLHYEPLGFEYVHPQFKDADGYWTGVVVLGFANVTATSLGSSAPLEARDFLKPRFKDQLVFTFPNDDDAVLFFFRQLVDVYGWDFVAALLRQNPTFIRGTAASAAAVYSAHYEATFATFSGLQTAPGATALFTVPKHSPWVSWAQRAAILAAAPHPAAAKLYISWLLSTPAQSSGQTWSPRSDIPPPPGYKPIFDYRNTDPTGLERFLSDPGAVARFRAKIGQGLYVPDVTGPSPTGNLGLYPGTF